MKYNIWNKWDPLKVVMLGDTWEPDFFKTIKNDKVRSPLQQISEETLEELTYFETVLKDFGCKVIRPYIDKTEVFEFKIEKPRNALQPRDYQHVIGNKLYTSNQDNPGIVQGLLEYSQDISYFLPEQEHGLAMQMSEHYYNVVKGSDYPSYEYFIKHRKNTEAFAEHVYPELIRLVDHADSMLHMPTSANSFLIGKDVYMDYTVKLPMDRLEHIFPNTRVNILSHGHTHQDACFHTLKPGAIVSLHDFQNYESTFPGWDICYLENEGSLGSVHDFLDLKQKNQGKWYMPNQQDNIDLIHFIDLWLNKWVGYVEETVFDVNCLVLDEHHVCVSSLNNKVLNNFLKKHKMEPIHIPWRHRYFWDGGLHCITLDLYREGVQQDYFPEREQAIVQTELINC